MCSHFIKERLTFTSFVILQSLIPYLILKINIVSGELGLTFKTVSDPLISIPFFISHTLHLDPYPVNPQAYCETSCQKPYCHKNILQIRHSYSDSKSVRSIAD